MHQPYTDIIHLSQDDNHEIPLTVDWKTASLNQFDWALYSGVSVTKGGILITPDYMVRIQFDKLNKEHSENNKKVPKQFNKAKEMSETLLKWMDEPGKRGILRAKGGLTLPAI